MKDLKGTKTEANLMTAFAGESQARNKYTYFASVAKKEGYEQIAAIFQKTADNEKGTRKDVVQGSRRIGRYCSESALQQQKEKNYEWTDMYAQFAKRSKRRRFRRSCGSVRNGSRGRKTPRRKIQSSSEQR